MSQCQVKDSKIVKNQQEDDNKLTIGHTRFNKQFSIDPFYFSFQRIIKKQKWNLDNGMANGKYWEHIFHNIKQTQVRIFNLEFNMNQALLRSIDKIAFSQLIQLNLQSNFISNVESVSFIQAPQLQKLVLNNNCIVILKSLVKITINLPKLKDLDLQDNFYQVQNYRSFLNKWKPNRLKNDTQYVKNLYRYLLK